MTPEDDVKMLERMFKAFEFTVRSDVKRFRREGKSDHEIREEIVGRTYDLVPYFEGHPKFRHHFIRWAKLLVDQTLKKNG